jgi:uncharacterized RDD family membrane protein YckC
MSSNPPEARMPFGSAADQLTIQTPEQTEVDFTVAGIGSRFLAIAYDTLLQILVGIVAGVIGLFIVGAVNSIRKTGGIWTGAIFIIFYFLLYFGYYPFFEIMWNGQTPGKRKEHIRVIKDSGRPLTPAESIGRNLMRIVDILPVLYGVGILCAFLNKNNKRLGDLVVGSLVVREGSLQEMQLAWQSDVGGAAGGPVFLAAGNGLSPEDYVLIDSFLSRRSSLDYGVRVRIAEDVLQRLRAKLNISPDNTLSTEKILETLAHDRRATGSFS